MCNKSEFFGCFQANTFEKKKIKITFAMGPTKKDLQEVKESFAAAKRAHFGIHSKKDLRHNLHRHIVRMFTDDR